MSFNLSNLIKNENKIKIDLIDPDPDQPRRSFNNEKIKELAASISADGLLQPIGVWLVKETNRYQILFGERRFRACKLLNWDSIPAIVLDKKNIFSQISENLQRENLSPDEIASFLQKLADDGYTRSEIALKLSKSAAFVTQYLSFRTIEEPIRKLYDDKKTTDITLILELNSLYKKHADMVQVWVKDVDSISRKDIANLKEFINFKIEEEKNKNLLVQYTEQDARDVVEKFANSITEEDVEQSAKPLKQEEYNNEDGHSEEIVEDLAIIKTIEINQTTKTDETHEPKIINQETVKVTERNVAKEYDLDTNTSRLNIEKANNIEDKIDEKGNIDKVIYYNNDIIEVMTLSNKKEVSKEPVVQLLTKDEKLINTIIQAIEKHIS